METGMPYATTTFTADASQLTYGPLGWTVISSSEVLVTVGGVSETNFTYDSASSTITFDNSVTLTNGELIVATRSTEINTARVVYNPGSPILANDLNTSNDQLLNAIQDLNDEDGNLDVEIGVNRDNIAANAAAIASEEAARIAADNTLQGNINAEQAARESADTTLQGNIDSEEAAREAADTTLQGNIDTVEGLANAAQQSANIAQSTANANASDITDLETLTASQGAEIFLQGSQITSLGAQVGINSGDIAQNASDIATLQGGGSTNAAAIAQNATDIATNAADIATNSSDINTNAGTIFVQGNQIVSVQGVAAGAVTDAAAAQATADGAVAAASTNAGDIATLEQFVGAVTPTGASVQDVTSGYRSIATQYYNPDPSAVNPVTSLTANNWLGMIPAVYLDEQYELDTMAAQTTYVPAEGRFFLAGTQPGTFHTCRILYRVTPDEDESQLDLRLTFICNPTSINAGLITFNVGAIATVMSQGAGIAYEDEALISFYCGDSLFGPDQANAGSFTVQGKSTVDADFEFLSVTLTSHL
jgi:hypothetical protein